MITITLEINDDSLINDFASALGYNSKSPMTGKDNPQSPAEFTQVALAKHMANVTSRKNRFQAMKQDNESALSKITLSKIG